MAYKNRVGRETFFFLFSLEKQGQIGSKGLFTQNAEFPIFFPIFFLLKIARQLWLVG